MVQFRRSIENAGQCFDYRYRQFNSFSFAFFFFPVLFIGENSPKLFDSFKQITRFVETNEAMAAMSTFHSSFYWKLSQLVYCLGKFQFVANCNNTIFGHFRSQPKNVCYSIKFIEQSLRAFSIDQWCKLDRDVGYIKLKCIFNNVRWYFGTSRTRSSFGTNIGRNERELFASFLFTRIYFRHLKVSFSAICPIDWISFHSIAKNVQEMLKAIRR